MSLSSKPSFKIFGSGAHAKVIADILLSSGESRIVFSDLRAGRIRLGERDFECVTDDEFLSALKTEGNFVIGLGYQLMKRRIDLAALLTPETSSASLLHPTANVSASSHLESGTVVMAGAVVGPYSRVGRHCVVNTSASIDHDARIGNNVFIQPGSVLAGNVSVGDNCLVGMGALILEGRSIGENSVVGAGSLVDKDVPPGQVHYGSPARYIRGNPNLKASP